jgi:hypothetical protein
MFEDYFVTHALEFSDVEEHHLQYHSLYLRFQDMFEQKLDNFAVCKGVSSREFVSRLRSVRVSVFVSASVSQLTRPLQAQQEDAKAAHYVSILLASVEYETFVALMRLMRPVARQRLDSKGERAAYTVAELSKTSDKECEMRNASPKGFLDSDTKAAAERKDTRHKDDGDDDDVDFKTK